MPSFSKAPHIAPFLWRNGTAEQAAQLYCSIFPNSHITGEFRSPVDTPNRPAGEVLTVTFELDGLHFTALNAGPHYPYTPAISFVVRCEDQQEIDRYWHALTTDGGKESQCGWLVDKFGLSWQIVPDRMSELLRHPKAMQAMMKMTKLVIAELEAAGSGEATP